MAKGGARPLGRVVALLVVLGWGAGRASAQPAPNPPPSPPPEDLAPSDAAGGQPAPAPSVPEPEPPPRPESSAAEPVSPVAAPLPAEPEPMVSPEERSRPEELRYLLERVQVEGNQRTKVGLIKRFVPLETGSSFDVNDPELQALRYRLLGTGWYDRVELRLERGKHPGWVVLVIQVEERQTLVFQQLAAGVGWSVQGVSERRGDESAPGRKAEPYLGLAIADTNFWGSGRTLGGQLLVAPDQQGFELNYFDPLLRGSRWAFRSKANFVNGQEYFGGDRGVQVSVQCEGDQGEVDEDCEISPDAAVVDYWRAGLVLGTARDIGSFTRLSIDWQGEYVYVPDSDMPAAASESRGKGPGARAPIDFDIEPGSSFVSMLTLGFSYDKRDSAVLPSRGLLASFTGDLASQLIGSTYDFVRLQASVHRWSQLPWGHTVRTGAYAGAVFGNPPFFHKFFVSDLTDLMPSRILGLNLDHRPAPNLFGVFECGDVLDNKCGTAVAEMRQEELAARIDFEYTWPIVRGRRKFLRSGDAFALIGLYALADRDDLRVAIPGYEGIARFPIDLTFDLGVRLDTEIGVFQVGVAKLLWLPAK